MKRFAQIFAAFALSILIVQCGKDVALKQASNMPTMDFAFDGVLANTCRQWRRARPMFIGALLPKW